MAKNTLNYKGYTGSVNFDADDKLFHGRILGTTDVIGFEGTSVKKLEKDFHDAVDDYLETCRQIGKEPEKPFSGRLVLRLNSEDHRAMALAAKNAGKSLNSWIVEKCTKSFDLS